MALNKSSLGPTILNLEKNNNALLVDVTLNEFAVVNNSITKQKMIAFTVVEHPEYYFWASTALFTFLEEGNFFRKSKILCLKQSFVL